MVASVVLSAEAMRVRVLPLIGIVVVVVGAACAEPAPSAAPRPATSVFSADAGAGLSVAALLDGGLPFAKAAEPGVLDEIVAASPKALRKNTGPDGGTLVGTETKTETKDEQAADAEAALSSKEPGVLPLRADKPFLVKGGNVEMQGLPAHAIERATRAQLYYPLVMRCRDLDGKILPPDAIVLRFKIDEEGSIAPSSISAVAVDPRHESSANCMRRELSATPFRAPAAARGVATHVRATIPSVD